MCSGRMDRPLAEAIRAVLMLNRSGADDAFNLKGKVTSEQLVVLVQEALRNELSFHDDAADLIWEIARNEGFVIPACPVESRGDAKAFLKEEDVKSAEEWYKKRGFTQQEMHNLRTTSAFVARNDAFWRKIIPVPRLASKNPNKLAPYLVQALDFCLNETTPEEDPSVFLC